MASLQLPRPARQYEVREERSAGAEARAKVVAAPAPQPPRYRARKGFVPRRPEDHGDGGAFPEVHVAQYPLGMGRRRRRGAPGSGASASATSSSSSSGGGAAAAAAAAGGASGSQALTLAVDSKGQPGFDAIVKRGAQGRAVQTRYEDLVAQNSTVQSNDALQLPTADEEAETAQRTSAALSKIVGHKLESSRAVQIVDNTAASESLAKPRYVAYEPQGAASAGKPTRLIRMVEAQKDPLELPRTKIKKQARDAEVGSLVPVLQAPDEKPTRAERADWTIPPCISSWKNPQSYVIPLDKRLATDARGLQQTAVNDKFASLSEALYIAENQARQEVEARNREKQMLLQREKEHKENDLRELARAARMERNAGGAVRDELPADGHASIAGMLREGAGLAGAGDVPSDRSARAVASELDPAHGQDARAERDRERLRNERKRERERALRLEAAGKKSKLARDGERDVSERIALGMAVPNAALGGGDAAFDSRLFNQSEGLSSGFGADDDYNVYSTPLFNRQSEHIYRPKANESSRFGSAAAQLDKIRSENRFESGSGSGSNVQFERQADSAQTDFGQLVGAGEGRRAGDRVDKALGSRRTGVMSIAASGAARGDEAKLGSGRTKINFEPGSN